MKLWEVLVRFWRKRQMTVLGWLWVSPESQARCLDFSALDHGGAGSREPWQGAGLARGEGSVKGPPLPGGARR